MASANAQHPPWSEDRVAREMEAWFAQRAFEEWPTYATFVRDGRKRLHAALVRTGGPQRWAQELGVLLREHPPGGGLRDDEVLATLRSLLGEHRPQRFPTISWFERHGPHGLPAAIRRTGGIAHWAAVLNMPPPPGTHWTDELIESELRRVCADATRWPSRALRGGRRGEPPASGLCRARQPLVGTAARPVDRGPASPPAVRDLGPALASPNRGD